MDVKIETITPEVARAMLEMNTGNFRKPESSRVERYAREMRRGEWLMNGDSIRFNGSVLLDGQHRLLAVVKSGVAIQSIVIRDLENVGHTLDRGRPRTVAQWLTHRGIRNGCDVAATTKLVIAHDKGLWGSPSPRPEMVSDSEIVTFAELHNEDMQAVIRLAGRAKGLVPRSSLAAILLIGGRKGRPVNETSEWFTTALGAGCDLTEVEPVYHLRNRILSQTRANPLTPFMKRAFCTIAWNKTCTGEPCSANSLRVTMTGPAKRPAPGEILQCDQA